MNFMEYQESVKATSFYPGEHGIVYTALGLNGEAGEYAEKIKKIIRDDGGLENISPEKHSDLVLELGDVLWYITEAARTLGVSLATVAKRNIAKLESRKERGKLSGSGDNR